MPATRKRSRSLATGESKTKTKKRTSVSQAAKSFTNPFQEVYQRNGQNKSLETRSESMEVFDQMLLFTEISTVSFKQTCADDEQGTSDQLAECVEGLLKYIAPTEHQSPRISIHDTSQLTTSTLTSLVSPTDAVRLLLPWAIKGVLQSDGHAAPETTTYSTTSTKARVRNLYWNVLQDCLISRLSAMDEDRHDSLLTLSTMHKIVPIALKVALKGVERDTVSAFAIRSYIMLTDVFYQPAFDSICETMLPILANSLTPLEPSEVDTSTFKSDDTFHNSAWQKAANATFRLLISRLAKANPKKSFQLLVREETFLHLAIVYHHMMSIKATPFNEQGISQFHEFVSEAYFALEHHMDGFRSLKLQIPTALGKANEKPPQRMHGTTTGSSFHCYQEGLLDTLESFVTRNDGNGGLLVAVVDFGSFLLDAFFTQALKLREQQQHQKHRTTTKKNSVDKLSQLQFRLTARVTGDLVSLFMQFCETSNDESEEAMMEVLSAIAKNLELLLQYNTYRSSVDSTEEKSFLQQVAKTAIGIMVPRLDGGEKTREANEEICLPKTVKRRIVTVLGVLLKLDHTVLHDHLENILTWCLSYESEISDGRASLDFLISAIRTYGKLRQLDCFFTCLNNSFRTLVRTSDTERLSGLNAFLKDNEIVMHLRHAIHSSPVQQMKLSFSNTNQTIAATANASPPSITALVAVSAAAHILTGFMQYARVDSNTHSEVLVLVGNIMGGCIQALLPHNQDIYSTPASIICDALSICSWAIDAKIRCNFWASEGKQEQSSKELAIPSQLLRILNDAASGADVVACKDRTIMSQLKFFACQRIKQLHMAIFERQRVAFAMDTEECSWRDEISEAQKLASFVLTNEWDITRADKFPSNYASWLALADTIHTWAPHADRSQTDLFMNFLFHVLSTVHQTESPTKGDIAALLQDASFYEASSISRRLGLNAVAFVAGLVAEAVNCYSTVPKKLLRLAQPDDIEDVDSLPVDDLFELYVDRPKLKLQPNHGVDVESLLRKGATVMKVTNGLQLLSWELCDDAEKTLVSVLRIDAVLCSVFSSSLETTTSSFLISLVCSLRLAASRILNALRTSRLKKIEMDQLLRLIVRILKTSGSLVGLLEGEKEQHDLISSCSSLLSSALSLSLASEKDTPVGIDEMLVSMFQRRSDCNNSSNMVIIACVSQVLRIFRSSMADINLALSRRIVHAIGESVWQDVQKVVFNQDQAGSLIWDGCLVLISEGLLISAECTEPMISLHPVLDTDFLTNAVSLLRWEVSPSATRSIAYLLSCLGLCKIPNIEKDAVVRELSTLYFSGKEAFKTPLCSFAKTLARDQLENLLNKLSTYDCVQDTTAAKAALLHGLLLSLSDGHNVELLAKHSASILSTGLAVMNRASRDSSPDGDSVLTASSLILELSSRREVATIRERDIALILASVAGTLQAHVSFSEDRLTTYRIKAFGACYSLAASFLQRFTKQVQSCVPLLISKMMIMLQFILYARIPENILVECGQKFCRICELLLPHGDVYKKHVLCLIIEFVRGLGDEMDSIRRDTLLAGIYCLLDIIQEHEIQQLNVMLDDMGRAMLSTIHEGYKKRVYKGQ